MERRNKMDQIYEINENQRVRLNIAIPTQATDTNGLSLSPITAALLKIPLNPFLCDSTKLGQIALM